MYIVENQNLLLHFLHKKVLIDFELGIHLYYEENLCHILFLLLLLKSQIIDIYNPLISNSKLYI